MILGDTCTRACAFCNIKTGKPHFIDHGEAHLGGSFSMIEILIAIYEIILKDEDKFILSKAHACPVLYAALAETGFFDKSELMTFRKLNSRLQGHAHIKTPGVEMSGGSLGQGLSFGVGVSLAAKIDKKTEELLCAYSLKIHKFLFRYLLDQFFCQLLISH